MTSHQNPYPTQIAENLRFVAEQYRPNDPTRFCDISHYLHLFDHIFTRSINDYNIAINEVGINNVSYYPDISICLMEENLQSEQRNPIEPLNKPEYKLVHKILNKIGHKKLLQSDLHSDLHADLHADLLESTSQDIKIKIGLCLAQPVFYNNPKKLELITQLTNVLIKLYQNHPNIEYQILTFNYILSHNILFHQF